MNTEGLKTGSRGWVGPIPGFPGLWLLWGRDIQRAGIAVEWGYKQPPSSLRGPAHERAYHSSGGPPVVPVLVRCPGRPGGGAPACRAPGALLCAAAGAGMGPAGHADAPDDHGIAEHAGPV